MKKKDPQAASSRIFSFRQFNEVRSRGKIQQLEQRRSKNGKNLHRLETLHIAIAVVVAYPTCTLVVVLCSLFVIVASCSKFIHRFPFPFHHVHRPLPKSHDGTRLGNSAGGTYSIIPAAIIFPRKNPKTKTNTTFLLRHGYARCTPSSTIIDSPAYAQCPIHGGVDEHCCVPMRFASQRCLLEVQK